MSCGDAMGCRNAFEGFLDTVGSDDWECRRASLSSSAQRVSRVDMSEREIDFLEDDPADMTYARRAALHLMGRYGWYNPRLDEDRNEGRGDDGGGGGSSGEYVELDDMRQTKGGGSFNGTLTGGTTSVVLPREEEKPSLEKAWAYFDHVTLPRFLHRPEEDALHRMGFCGRLRHVMRMVLRGQEHQLDLAEPGENRYPTKLYSPLWTPHNQMGDFGLGVGLYFSALWSLTVITLLAGLINIPNMIYFAGDEYSASQEGVPFTLRGSAICTVQEWVPCPSCSVDDFANALERIAVQTSDYYGEELVFALKNGCDGARLPVGLVNYATLVFIIVGMLVLNRYLRRKEVEFDEDEQTAQDYSIVVRNPPPDATDPEEWRAYFEDGRFGADVHVTCCTVAIDNDLLVRALVRRRELLQKLKLLLPPGTSLHLAHLSEVAERDRNSRSVLSRMRALIIPGLPEVLGRLVSLNEKIRKLSLLPPRPATRVFVTLETEAAQRRVLSALCRGRSRAAAAHRHHPFRDVVLDAKEAGEPSTVRWQDLSNRFRDRALRLLLTSYVCACSTLLVGWFVKWCRDRSALFAAFAISGTNAAFPEFAKLVTNHESHASEDRRQTSLYVKIAVFRWINTAIIICMITPFTSTLTEGTNDGLNGVKAIFFAEIVTTNAIKFADPVGFFKRHYLAPRATTQEAMNSHMRGEEYNLAERYTNMTKLMFLALWYCSIFPGALWYCSLTNFINYFADRFSLMRTWKQAPRLGARISSFCRRYFFTSAISAMAIASSYAWTGFPYDNLCENNDDDDSVEGYQGTWTVTTADGSTSEEVTVSNGDPTYRFCSQDLMRYDHSFKFPALPRFQPEGDKWMTEEQETLTSFYGWTSLFLVGGVCMWIISRVIYVLTKRGTYEPCGEDQGINFSDVPSISSYVPEVKSDAFPYPLLAANTDDIYEELYEWKDPDKPYSYYDLTRDMDEVLKDTLAAADETKMLFSRIKYWSPYEKLEMPATDESSGPQSDSNDPNTHTGAPEVAVGEPGPGKAVLQMNSSEIISSVTETEVVTVEGDQSGVYC